MIDSYEQRTFSGKSDRERRTKRRFEIDQEIRYKMLYGQRIAETGVGRTMNISSGGVWFSTERVPVFTGAVSPTAGGSSMCWGGAAADRVGAAGLNCLTSRRG